MSTRLRNIAWINPPTGGFEALPRGTDVTFMPLEAVWSGDGADVSRTRPVKEVASGYVRFMEGDVLCPKVTPTFQAGRSMVVPPIPSQVGAATTEVHVVRAKPGLADPRFLMYRLLTQDFLSEGVSRFQGVAGLQRVPAEFLMDLPVADFPVEEQRRIADFLDDQVARIDELTDARQRQRNLLQERLRVVRDSVIDGDRVAVRRVTSLLRDGTHASVPRVDEGVPLLSVRNIQDGVFAFREDDSFVSCEDYVAIDSACPARRGDVLLAIVGATLGKTALVELDEPFCLQRSVAVLRPRPETLSAAWLLNALRTTEVQDQLWLAAGFSAQPGVYLGTVADLRIPVPDLSTQTEALDFLRNYESQIGRAALEQTLAARQLEERKRALITAAVTGELDVATARPIGMGKWVPNVGASVEAPAAAQSSSIGGIG